MTPDIPTVGTCACGDTLITSYRWKRLPVAQRAELRADGYNAKATENECDRCAQRRRYTPRRVFQGYYRDEVLAEWERFVDRRECKRRNVAALAPRLGMTVGALEQALRRAGVRSWAS